MRDLARALPRRARRRRRRRRGRGGRGAAHADAGPVAGRSGVARRRRSPFHGAHQAGIATAAQDRLAFAAFDVTTTDAERRCAGVLRELDRGGGRDDRAACRCPATSSRPDGAAGRHRRGARAAAGGADRHRRLRPVAVRRPVRAGRAAGRPRSADLPALPGDELDPQPLRRRPRRSRPAPNDPQVAFHVIRNLARIGRGVGGDALVAARLRPHVVHDQRRQATPRNLMGFKDGTRNIHGEDTAAMDEHVWVGDETDQAWMRGGTYLVARRIRMLIESLGPRLPRRPGGRLRPAQGRAARRSPGRDEFDAAGLRRQGAGRRAGHPARTRTSGWPRPENNDGLRDPAPRLLLHRRHRPGHRASSTPACSSSRSSRTRARSSSRCSASSAATTR